MRAVILAVALTLGGCANMPQLPSLSSIGTGISLATASVTNPVTKQREADIELAADTAIVALKGYKQACKLGKADVNCRANIAAIQRYTIQMPPLITQLRKFSDANDQINAIVVYNQLLSLYGNFKTAAASLGYNVGNLP